VVAFVLLPIYYRLNVVSIYTYLDQRFGTSAYKTGAFFFLLSRVLGASFRLFLVATVLQQFVFDYWNFPFEGTVILSVLFIWAYTYKGGIKTIVWTDSLQTGMMLFSVVAAVVLITQSLELDLWGIWEASEVNALSQVWVTDDPLRKDYWVKSVLGGAFITIAMTGLDQDMMQKNLSCRNLGDAQKNMISMSIVLVLVNVLFLVLGALLFAYSAKFQVEIPNVDGAPKTDLLFPQIALNGDLGLLLGITFILGLIAAAYSSADSALTALTTSFCIDFISMEGRTEADQKKLRKQTHVGMSALLVAVIISFKYLLEKNTIDGLLTVATYTYGPLLGLFAFGILTEHKVRSTGVWWVAGLSLVIAFLIGNIPATTLGGYQLGYELLPINGAITFLGLWLIRLPANKR
jgi:Na+/proline symporter